MPAVSARRHIKTNPKVVDSYQRQPDATVSDDRKSLQTEASWSTESFDRPSAATSFVIQSTISRWEAQQPHAQASVHSIFQGSPASRERQKSMHFRKGARSREDERRIKLIAMIPKLLACPVAHGSQRHYSLNRTRILWPATSLSVCQTRTIFSI